MNTQDYQHTITTNLSPREVIAKICSVQKWWANDFTGKSAKLNDVFTVRFKGGDMYTCKVSEIIPNKKIVWDVIDAYQGWHDNHKEWVDTYIVWEVTSQEDGTQIKMTHVGLVPAFECYSACHQGWDYLIGKSLQKYLDDNEGMPA